MDSAKEIPIGDIPSPSPFVVLDADRKVTAECVSAPESIRALKAYVREHPGKKAAIYRRDKNKWVKY
jgi:hypothetical protein